MNDPETQTTQEVVDGGIKTLPRATVSESVGWKEFDEKGITDFWRRIDAAQGKARAALKEHQKEWLSQGPDEEDRHKPAKAT